MLPEKEKGPLGLVYKLKHVSKWHISMQYLSRRLYQTQLNGMFGFNRKSEEQFFKDLDKVNGKKQDIIDYEERL